ncbi:TonB-dependent receptor [Mannheimia haemolytica]
MKYQPTQDTLLTLAGFKITQKDLANYQWQTRSYEQIGEVQTKGIEVSLNQQLSDKFSIAPSYAYLKKRLLQIKMARRLEKRSGECLAIKHLFGQNINSLIS